MKFYRLIVVYILAICDMITADERSVIAKNELQYLFSDFDSIIPPTSIQVVESICIDDEAVQTLEMVKQCAESMIESYWLIFERYLVFQDPDTKFKLLDTFWTYISNMTKRTNLAQTEGIPLEDAYKAMLEQYFP